MAFVQNDYCTVTFVIVAINASGGREQRKDPVQFLLHGATPADVDANLRTAISAYIVDYDAMTEAHIQGYYITHQFSNDTTPVPLPTADVFHESLYSVRLAGFANKVAVLALPAPADGTFTGDGTPAPTNGTFLAWLDNFQTGDARISDGEEVKDSDAVVRVGQRNARNKATWTK